ncbi:unnamed protein product [Penicillium bialowiezense]
MFDSDTSYPTLLPIGPVACHHEVPKKVKHPILLGPGAQHHEDWNKVEIEMHDRKTSLEVDQGSFLPDSSSFQLESIRLPVMKYKEASAWLCSVKEILRAYDLDSLVVLHVARPWVDSPNAQRCFLDDLSVLEADYVFADEFVAAIEARIRRGAYPQ